MIVQCRAAAALREREQAPPLSVLQIFRSVVDDPVARAAPAPADIIDRPSSIVAPNQTANNNPLKRKGDVDQQPYSRLEPVGLLGAARSHSSLESARASRARVGAASPVNAMPKPPVRQKASLRTHPPFCKLPPLLRQGGGHEPQHRNFPHRLERYFR